VAEAAKKIVSAVKEHLLKEQVERPSKQSANTVTDKTGTMEALQIQVEVLQREISAKEQKRLQNKEEIEGLQKQIGVLQLEISAQDQWRRQYKEEIEGLLKQVEVLQQEVESGKIKSNYYADLFMSQNSSGITVRQLLRFRTDLVIDKTISISGNRIEFTLAANVPTTRPRLSQQPLNKAKTYPAFEQQTYYSKTVTKIYSPSSSINEEFAKQESLSLDEILHQKLSDLSVSFGLTGFGKSAFFFGRYEVATKEILVPGIGQPAMQQMFERKTALWLNGKINVSVFLFNPPGKIAGDHVPAYQLFPFIRKTRTGDDQMYTQEMQAEDRKKRGGGEKKRQHNYFTFKNLNTLEVLFNEHSLKGTKLILIF